MAQEAIGLIETKGLCALLEAALREQTLATAGEVEQSILQRGRAEIGDEDFHASSPNPNLVLILTRPLVITKSLKPLAQHRESIMRARNHLHADDGADLRRC